MALFFVDKASNYPDIRQAVCLNLLRRGLKNNADERQLWFK